MAQYKENEFDVIVIGGGITGAGTARDCSLRGLRTLLIERNDIADGATGRNHGLLHSGARVPCLVFLGLGPVLGILFLEAPQKLSQWCGWH